MISYVPYFRSDRKAIVIRIIVDGNISKVINTGIKIEPSQWNEKHRKVTGHANKNIFNQKIQNKIGELQKEITKAELLGVQLTRDRVKKISEGAAITTDFHKWSEAFIEEAYKNEGTRKAHTSDHNRLKLFAPSLQFGDIDARWLKKYEKWLYEHFHGNTPWKSLKFVRRMLYGAGKGIVHHNPFEYEEYKMPKYIQPLKDGLTIEELDKLEKLLTDPVPVMHKIITAKFLFMCYTGLRISDAKSFKVEKHVHNGERIVITSKKTGVTTNLKLYSRLSKVLQTLNELPDKAISDQKFNDWLKIIAGLAEINRLTLTTHVGRHTFGCLLAEMGVSEEEAMKLMGHKRKEVTKIYFQLRQPQIDRAAEKLNKI